MRAGEQVRAGLAYATVVADWDVETYSEAGFVWDEATGKWHCLPGASQGKKGLPVVGAARYFEHPTADVLHLSYDLKDGLGIRRWRPGQPVPADWRAHIEAGRLIEAHNTAFEAWANRKVLVPKYGFPPIAPEQMRCSMIKARAWSMPGSLANLGDVLNIDAKKDKDGKRLLDKFSVPRNPTQKDARRRIRPDEDPAEAERLYAYNDRDIEAEAEASLKLPDLPPAELEYWLIDQAINRRGVHVDRAGVRACLSIVEQAHEHYNLELRELTHGRVRKASEIARMQDWLAHRGVYAPSLAEEHLAELLADTSLPLDARRALEIRATIGSAAVKKVYAIENMATEADRLHDLFTGHGARTGRPVGQGPQPTNLPNSGPDCYQCPACTRWYPAPRIQCPHCAVLRGPDVRKQDWNPDACDDALRIIAAGSFGFLEMVWTDAMATVSACLRGLFNAAPGHDLIGSDYTAIEAVVNAMLSGEQWRIDVFRSHGKIYEASAAAMFDLPVETLLAHPAEHNGAHHPLRKKGKVAELALGYLGWIGALRAMGGYEGSDADATALCVAWREASPSIVWMGGGQKAHPAMIAWHEASIAAGGRPCSGPEWDAALALDSRWERVTYLYGLEGGAVRAIQTPGVAVPVYQLGGKRSGLTLIVWGGVLYLILPSGRRIAYHAPRLSPSAQAWRGLSISFEGWNTNPKMGGYGWITLHTYAGKLLENACQATANDVLRHGQVQLERAGYPIVLHVYDENVAEVPEGFGSVEGLEAEMNKMPAWAAGWPIRAAKGWRGKRFRK